MYQSVDTKYQFEQAFKEAGRGEQFSHDGLDALFDYLEEMEESTGEKLELDVIALCCDYVEYANLAEFQSDYSAEEYPDIEAIEARTSVIRIPGSDGFIIQVF